MRDGGDKEVTLSSFIAGIFLLTRLIQGVWETLENGLSYVGAIVDVSSQFGLSLSDMTDGLYSLVIFPGRQIICSALDL